MIQGHLQRPVSSKPIRASGYHSDFVVQPLDRAAGQLPFRAEPIHQQFLMAAEHAGHFLHGLKPTALGPAAPALQERGGAAGRSIGPKVLKRLFQNPRPAGRQLAAHDLEQFTFGVTAHPAAPPQKLPAHFFESLRLGLAEQTPRFRPAHLVHRLVQVLRNMKAIQDMQRVADLPGNDVEVGFPHVAANKPQALDHFRSEGFQTVPQTGLRPARADPQQPLAMPVDLINHRQKVGAFPALAAMDLVHADRLDPFQFAVGQPPLHEPLDRAVNRFPTRAEDSRRFAPRQPSRPAGQESHHGRGDPLLARIPRHVFDHHPVRRALHPARRVDKLRRDAPQRHEHPAALFQPVVAGARLPARSAARPALGVRLDVHLDFSRVPGADQAHAAVNEAGEVLHQIQEGFHCQLRGWRFLFHTRFDGRSGLQAPATHCLFSFPADRDSEPEAKTSP